MCSLDYLNRQARCGYQSLASLPGERKSQTISIVKVKVWSKTNYIIRRKSLAQGKVKSKYGRSQIIVTDKVWSKSKYGQSIDKRMKWQKTTGNITLIV